MAQPAARSPAPSAARAQALHTAAAGQALYQAENYPDALEDFRRAYALYPSPDLLVYIAACLVNLRLEIEAVRALLDFFVDPGQSKQELRTLALRLWQQSAPAVREGLVGPYAERLPPTVRRKLERLPAWHREQLPQDLRRLLLPVQVEVTPPKAELEVDGAPMAGTRLYLTRGRHQVRAVPPSGSAYLPAAIEIDVAAEDQQATLRLPQGLRVRAPQGSTVLVDDRAAPSVLDEGLLQQSLVPVSPGRHQVMVISPRLRRTSRVIEVRDDQAAEVLFRPPALWPGLLLAGAGVASLVTGAALLAINGTCATPGDITVCQRVYQTDAGGYAGVALGAAALGAGAIWFAYNAVDHPYFRRPAGRRISWQPAPVPGGGLLLLGSRF